MEQVMTVGESFAIIESDGGENLKGQYRGDSSKSRIPDIPKPKDGLDWQLITAIPRTYPNGRQYIQYIWQKL